MTADSRFRRTLSQASRFFRLGHVPIWTLLTLPVAIVAMSVLAAIPPLLIGRIVDSLQHLDSAKTMRELMLYLAVAFASGVLGLGLTYTTTIFRETLSRNIQLTLLDKIKRASLEGMSTLTLGQVTNRLLGDVRQLSNQLEYSIFPVLSNVCTIVATILVMVRVDYRLAAIAFVCAFAVVLPLRISSPRVAALGRSASTENDRLVNTVNEAVSAPGLTALRNPIAGMRIGQIFQKQTAEVFRLRVRGVLVGAFGGLGTSLAAMIGPIGVMALGAYLVVHGQLSAGAIVSVLIYQSRISAPFMALSGLQTSFATMGVTIERLMEIADLPEQDCGTAAFSPGRISLQGVCLVRGEHAILNRVTIDVEQGQHVAIVGESGAGKSSLAALFPRFAEATAGRMMIGENRIDEIHIGELRKSICLVPQDPFLTHASLRENITLNCESVDPQALENVVSAVQLSDLVERLPDGLDTIIGHRGFPVSGGERQRICLARGLLQDAQILILDEALSGVDIEMERQILADVRKAFVSKNLFVITHRVSSVMDFDTFIVLESGALIASGPPNEVASSYSPSTVA